MARAAIISTNEQWMASFDDGDAAGIVIIYAEDTQVMPPNSKIVCGRKAVQSVSQRFIDAALKVKLDTIEMESHGDIAFKVGMADVIGPEGQMLDKSTYIVIWKIIGSEWKMYRTFGKATCRLYSQNRTSGKSSKAGEFHIVKKMVRQMELPQTGINLAFP